MSDDAFNLVVRTNINRAGVALLKPNSERTSRRWAPKFPRLQWKRKKEAQVILDSDHCIQWVGGFHEQG